MIRLDHLRAMTDRIGLFEHAAGSSPRLVHGYCTDDNARLLIVASREPDEGVAAAVGRIALDFVIDAQASDGRVRNRRQIDGRWTDALSTDDCWGRSVWGLGVAATEHDDPGVRARALEAFDRGCTPRSRWPHAMAFAALGAAAVVAVHRDHAGARALLHDAATTIGAPPPGPWRWPLPRLTYANAAIAEAVLAAGIELEEPTLMAQGLDMLEWLLDHDTQSGHLSFTGVGGADPTTVGPQFDQQPIEAAAMADACWRALTLTGQATWSHGVNLAFWWFHGVNDSAAMMFDEVTGGGYDGLTPDGVNLNQGAESTLALISTTQRARALVGSPW